MRTFLSLLYIDPVSSTKGKDDRFAFVPQVSEFLPRSALSTIHYFRRFTLPYFFFSPSTVFAIFHATHVVVRFTKYRTRR